MKLRISAEDWEPFATELRLRKDVESAGIILAEVKEGGEVLVARSCRTVPVDGYLVRKVDLLSIDPVVLNRLVRPARERRLAVVTVHTHPGTQEPWFSLADDVGDSRLMPSLYVQTPGPHGSLVVAGETGRVGGRVWSPSGARQPLEVHVVGGQLKMHLSTPTSESQADGCFHRQELALGAMGQARLRHLHVVIVGLGGTGSVVLAQLAHLGVGRLTLIDGDVVEPANVSRIVGATLDDVGRPKVEVAARYVRALGLATKVETLHGQLGIEVEPDQLGSGDVIFSCVDRHTPRSILNRLSYEMLIPVIDLGTALRVGTDGRVTAGAGRVVLVGPSRSCLACWGHLDPDQLRVEAMAPEERASLAAEGYVQGVAIEQPSVIGFNTAVAGAAVVEFLRMVTGFGGTEDPPARLAFDFLSGTVRRTRLGGSRSCSICGAER